MALTDEQKDEIQNKLIHIYSHDPEGLTRVLYYFNEIDEQYQLQKIEAIPQVWRTLFLTLNSDRVFKQYADRLVADTKSAENDPKFRAAMQEIYEKMIDPSDGPFGSEDQQGCNKEKKTDLAKTSRLGGLISLGSIISDDIIAAICKVLPKVSCRQVSSAADEIVGIISTKAGGAIMIGLASVFLCYEAYKCLRDWLNGTISGKRAVKEFIDAALGLTGGVVGGIMGASLGLIGGPIGAIIGGIASGIVAAKCFEYISDYLTQMAFNIPRERALENAYNYFGLHMNSSNDEINRIFRQKCLLTHPDKGGSQEDFLLVQIHMTAIRELRGKELPITSWLKSGFSSSVVEEGESSETRKQICNGDFESCYKCGQNLSP